MNEEIFYEMLNEWDRTDSSGFDTYYHLIAEFPTIDDFPNILDIKFKSLKRLCLLMGFDKKYALKDNRHHIKNIIYKDKRYINREIKYDSDDEYKKAVELLSRLKVKQIQSTTFSLI